MNCTQNFQTLYSAGECEKESFEKLLTESEKILKTLLDEFRHIRKKKSPSFDHYDLDIIIEE